MIRRGWLGALSAAGVIVVMAGLSLGADGVARQGTVHLRSGAVRTADRPNALDGAAFGQKWHLIVLDGPMDQARQAALGAAGVTLAGYLPQNAFIADLSGTTPARVKALAFVIWAGPYQKEWKVDSGLLAGANGRPFVTQARQAMAAQGLVATDVWLFKGEPEAPFRAAIAKLANAQVTLSEVIEGSVHLHVTLQAKDAPKLGDIGEVMFAEHAAEFTARSNAITRWVIQTDQPNMTPFYDNGVTGVGQIVGMIDGGLAYNHCSFADSNPIGPTHRKIVAAAPNPPPPDIHGTHTSCTAVGDAGDNTDTRGIAYGAKMTFQTYPSNTYTSVYGEFQFAHDNGARVHSNSWGDDSSTTYDGPCSAIDAFQHTNEDDLIIFAITDLNSWVRNPENAKNSLAVSLSGEYPSEDSPCGNVGGHAPTCDGRRKPEVLAPGCSINSANGNSSCGTVALTGTSMACPAVAGAAALVREYFTDGFYPTGHARASDAITPSGSLIKAALVNSSVDMGGIAGYPSDREGWGRVLLNSTIRFGSDPQHALVISDVRNINGLQTGQSGHVAINAGSASPLRVTLAYADAPALPQTGCPTPPLSLAINDLDLIVTAPNGDVYYGNNFAGGVSAPGGAPDAINNLEQVLVASPQPGRWDIQILGANVPQGPQGYAVVITGAVSQSMCGSADFNCDGDSGTDADIESFFACLAGSCPAPPCTSTADFNGDGDVGTDADIEAFFRVLAGNPC